MQVLSVNVSKPVEIIYRGEAVMTGIYKEPVNGRVALDTLNFDGDAQADLVAHGGPFKAVYIYPHEHYATWAEELDRDDLTYGQFGENLTTTGLLETTVHIGDVFRIGTAILEVTQPRVPCFKLEHKMAIKGFMKTFMQSQRSGFYLKVLEPGEVGAGDEIALVRKGQGEMTVDEIFHLLYFDKSNRVKAAAAAKLPALSPGWRGSFEQMAQ